MIDKSLVKKRFSKSFKTYNDNAVIQKKMAEELINFLPRKNFSNILEIGCATGVLTKKLVENIKFEHFTANDIVENAEKYISKIISDYEFILGDIEEIELKNKYDLIIANAVFQWCENPEKIVNKLMFNLNDNGVIAISIFTKDNFPEIKKILNLKSVQNINLEGITKEYKLMFNSPLEVLKHIKSTGANALTEYKFTKSSLKAFEENYKNLYETNGKVCLTYKPLYIVKAAPNV